MFNYFNNLNKAFFISFLTMFLLITSVRGQNIIYVSCNYGELYRVNIENCSYDLMGNSESMSDIALTYDGRLFGISNVNGFLREIDSQSGTSTFIDTIEVNGQYTSTNNLYALGSDTLLFAGLDSLYKISISDGAAFCVGYLPYWPAGDIVNINDTFYLSDQLMQLIKFEMNSSHTQVISHSVVNTMNTGGMVFGMFTAFDYCDGEQRLFACSANEIYQVDPVTANANLVCTLPDGCLINGAASVSLNLDADLSQMILPNVFSPNNDEINDIFSPFPLVQVSSSSIIIYNRWGNEIFSSEQDGMVTWDGIDSSGHAVADGVYYFVINYSPICGKKSTRYGFVNVLK